MRTTPTIIAILITLLIFLVFTAGVISAGITISRNSTERLCYEYEANRYIPKNSCYCSTQLFDSWDKSYNWIDACKVLEARNKK